MNEKKKDKADVNNFIDAQLNYFQIAFIVRDTSLIILLTVKIFPFDFENAGRRNIVTEKNKVIEEQGIRDHKSKLNKKLSFNAEKA